MSRILQNLLHLQKTLAEYHDTVQAVWEESDVLIKLMTRTRCEMRTAPWELHPLLLLFF